MVGRCTTTSSATACPPAAHRLPAELSMAIALALFLLSPVMLLAWAAGQALLRVTGVRWWKLALASLAAIGLVVMIEGGQGRPWPTTSPAMSAGCVRSAPRLSTCPCQVRSCGPSSPGHPGRPARRRLEPGRRQAIDPAEVRKQQRDATRRMESAVKRATTVRDDHFGPVALGVQIDGDLGWADRRGLVVVPRPCRTAPG